jgi:hypothetical protein
MIARPMEPSEFLSRDQFEKLPEEEAIAYMERVGREMHDAIDSGEKTARTLAFTEHYVDLAEWTLSPEDFERWIKRPSWEAVWDNAEEMLATLERLSESEELSEAERRDALERAEQFRALAQHKRDIESL